MESPSIRYDRIPFSDELFPITIEMHSRLAPKKSGSGGCSWHEQLEVLYITKGRVLCECNFRQYICSEGDIVVINPCDAHSVEYIDEAAYYLCLMVDPRLYGGNDDISAVKYIRPMSDRRVRFRNVIRHNPSAKAILLELFSEYQNASPAYEMAVKGNLLRFLAELFRSEIDETETGGRHSDTEQIAPALRYISDFYAEEISLDRLANACCMNRSYFCRRFREITGKTAIGYVNEYRLAKARALLTASRLSVSEIALATGFPDSNYFARCFKKHFGLSPRVCRSTAERKVSHEST